MIFRPVAKGGRCLGYARVSTDDQKLDLQLDALRSAGCKRVFADHGISGRRDKRPELDKLIQTLKSGDTIIVYKLSRLGRSTKHLAQLLADFIERDIAIYSLSEGIDISTTSGKLMYHLIAAFAEYDADIIRENTINGLRAAKARGKHIGRPYKLSLKQVQNAHQRVTEGGECLELVSKRYGVRADTMQRNFARLESEAA